MTTSFEYRECPLPLSLLQKGIRLLLGFPLTSSWMWQHMPRIRGYFAETHGERKFVAIFENTLRIRVSLSDHIESQIFWQGVQEADKDEVELLKSLLKPDDVFIDAGANIGVFTLMAAKQLPRGCVHAFEPSLYHIDKLRANLSLNQFSNIQIHPIALSNESCTSQLFFPVAGGNLRNTGMASQFAFGSQAVQTEEINCVRLDDYLKAHHIPRIDIIKIDVEGAELDVLTGGIESIRRFRPLVVMEVDTGHLHRARRHLQEVIDFWKSMQYEIFRIGPAVQLTPVHIASDLGVHQNIYCRPIDVSDLTEQGIAR